MKLAGIPLKGGFRIDKNGKLVKSLKQYNVSLRLKKKDQVRVVPKGKI